jgi:hypothetical protein
MDTSTDIRVLQNSTKLEKAIAELERKVEKLENLICPNQDMDKKTETPEPIYIDPFSQPTVNID